MAIKSVLIAALSAAALASPTPAAPIEARDAAAPVTIYPSTLSLWNSGSSTVTYNTAYGLVQRYSPSPNQWATLHTFSIPSSYASNTCELVFTLTAPGSYASGTQGAQVFFDNQPARAGATSDYRDVQIATFKAVNGGSATWGYTDGRSTGRTSFQVPCADLIRRPYIDVAPQGDNDYIYYQKGDGLKIIVS